MSDQKRSKDTQNQIIRGVSRSLPLLVQHKDDLAGMLAYALYKEQQSQWARDNNPTDHQVETYRTTLPPRVQSLRYNAEALLIDYGDRVREEMRDELRTELLEEVQSQIDRSVTNDLVERISISVAASIQESQKGKFWRDLVLQFLVWLVTIMVPIIVWLSFMAPDWKEILQLLQRLPKP